MKKFYEVKGYGYVYDNLIPLIRIDKSKVKHTGKIEVEFLDLLGKKAKATITPDKLVSPI